MSTGLLSLVSRHTRNVEQTEEIHADGWKSVDTLVIEVATQATRKQSLVIETALTASLGGGDGIHR